jgi:hypothetical protein
VLLALPGTILGLTLLSSPDWRAEALLLPTVFVALPLTVHFGRVVTDEVLCRLLGQSRHFLTASGRRVVLRYAPELHGQGVPQKVLTLAEKTLDEMEATFGRLPFWHRPLLFRRRFYVYLFPTRLSVTELFENEFPAFAVIYLHAVVVPFLGVPLKEVLRHEMGHLFAARWNAEPPPLLAEGLPTWLQVTEHGQSIDRVAAALLQEQDCDLRPLLDPSFFVDGENIHHSYFMAGSFTGFLIRRFGWDTYRQFYRKARADLLVELPWRDHFGMYLEELEQQWRSELLVGLAVE